MEITWIIVLSAFFVACVFLLGHSYALYPILMRWLSRGWELPVERFESDDELPEVAVLMAVYNEEDVLEKTLASIFASDYPEEKLRVWIGSDGSTDRSHEIVERFQHEHPRLHLSVFSGRNGKIRIVNQLASDAAKVFGDPGAAAFVICDANVAWSGDALRRMVAHFRRDDVGLVGAAIMDRDRDHDGIGDEEEAYVGLENRVKFAEGVLWGNMMGAFGACYAMRAKLFQPVPESHIVDDFYQTMSCLESGAKAIVDLDAVCYESVSTEISEEFRRKRRIATGNFQNLRHFRRFYRPWNGGWATWFAFWSHKGLRWIGPLLLLGAILSCIALAVLAPIFLIPLAGIFASVAAAAFDWVMDRVPRGIHLKPFRFARYFYAMNVALFLGLLAFLKGVRNSVWEPTKRVTSASRLTESEASVES